MKLRTAVRCLGILAMLFLIAAFVAAHQRADRYAERIRTGLEAALGRRVEIGDARFSLLTGPGFSLSNVAIHEEGAFGLEPFVYVDSLEARLRLLPLISGRIEFASLLLRDTSVNLSRSGEPRWNFTPLLHRRSRPALFGATPEIHVRSGRLNFKFGDSKSVFFFSDVDLDISPPSGADRNWEFRFTGEPARTDRPWRGFGRIAAGGQWRQAGQDARLAMDLRVERSAIGEIVGLTYGRDVGVHGFATSRLRVEGPTDDLRISGRLGLEGVHRWDLLPPKGETWTMACAGRLNLHGQTLELESHTVTKEAPPLSVRVRAGDYLGVPRWGVAVTWNRFRLEPLLNLARHMGAPLPPDLKLSGTLDGAAGYSVQGNPQGRLAFHDTALTVPGSPPIRFEQAELSFDSGRAHLAPAAVFTAANDSARLEADYGFATRSLDLYIRTDSMDVAALRAQASLAAVPLLEQLRSGRWRGDLRYRLEPGQTESGWSGSIRLTNATLALPGVAAVCNLDSAEARIDGTRVSLQHLRGSAGGIAFQGEYRYEPRLTRPHRFHLAIPSLDAAELERVLMPTLRRDHGLIARALRFGLGPAPVPEWLRTRRMDGSIQIGTLAVGGLNASRVRARVLSDGARVELADLQGRLENGEVAGRLSVDLQGAVPAYRLASRLKSADWNGGRVSADALVETSGIGDALLANLHSEGSFSGQGFALAPLNQFRTISGCYSFDASGRWRFTDLQLSTGAEVFTGHGATQSDGRLEVEVSSGSRHLNVTGTLAQLRFDEAQ